MKIVRRAAMVVVICGLSVSAGGRDVLLESPEGKTAATVSTDASGRLWYEVKRERRAIIEASPLGVTVDGVDLGAGVSLGAPARTSVDESYRWRGVHSTAVSRYNCAKIPVTHSGSGTKYTLEVRVFDDGAALRYIIGGDGARSVSGEATAFRLPAGCTVWFQTNTNNYEAQYQSSPIEQVPGGKHFGPPVVAEMAGGAGFAAITEAALFNYSGMTLRAEGGASRLLRAAFQDDKSWRLDGTIKTPWRVVIATSDLNGLVNSDIIANLNDPPPRELARARWIRPGRGLWHWWSGKIGNWDSVAFDRQFAWVDSTAELGFEYYLVDAGWELTWQKPGRDKWALLKELTDYAAKKKVGILVWKRWNTGRTEGFEMTGIDEAGGRRDFFERCRKAGAAGVKVDYMDSESKEMVDFYTDVLRDAAEFELMVNFHGANKPTGESRTWPNEVTREGIKGLEYNKWSVLPPQHYASLPFTRLVAGHGDFTPCTFNPEMLKGTTFALQLASAICFTSPVMHYADRPELYLNSPAVDVIKAIPSTWARTIVLPGSKIGDLAAFARLRSRSFWFVGIINGGGERTYELDLSFLGDGHYRCVQLADNADRPDDLVRSVTTVTPDRKIQVRMNAGGGFVAMLRTTR